MPAAAAGGAAARVVATCVLLGALLAVGIAGLHLPTTEAAVRQDLRSMQRLSAPRYAVRSWLTRAWQVVGVDCRCADQAVLRSGRFQAAGCTGLRLPILVRPLP